MEQETQVAVQDAIVVDEQAQNAIDAQANEKDSQVTSDGEEVEQEASE